MAVTAYWPFCVLKKSPPAATKCQPYSISGKEITFVQFLMQDYWKLKLNKWCSSAPHPLVCTYPAALPWKESSEPCKHSKTQTHREGWCPYILFFWPYSRFSKFLFKFKVICNRARDRQPRKKLSEKSICECKQVHFWKSTL